METLKDAGLDPTVITVFTNGDQHHVQLLPCAQVTEQTQIASALVKTGESPVGKDTSKYEYGAMCTEILQAVGGTNNIKNVFHCRHPLKASFR